MSEIFTSEQGNFVIEVSDDGFSAFLTIKNEEDFLNEKELLDLIATSKISFGFDNAQKVIETKNIQKAPNQAFPLAIGAMPKAPEIEFSPLFDNSKCYHPKLGNQFHLLKSLKIVKKGEPLAHLFVTKPSQSGTNVYGEEVKPEQYESQLIENYLGDNVAYSQERGQIIADKAGYPYLDDLPRVHIKSSFSLDGNLDLSFADMEFFGGLEVNGSITEGVKLKIDGDLVVNGDINEAEIEVNGDITVNGDILNCKNQGLMASGKITLNSAENSKIVAGEQVLFKKNLHFCRILAEKGILGDEESSTIVGGVCLCGDHIEASILGNSGGLATEIEISISPYIKEKMVNISKQMLRLKELKMTGNIEYINLQDELSNLEEKLDKEINIMLKNQDNLPKHIMAFKKVFPGTYIRILKKSMHITTEMNKVNFSIIGGELKNEGY